MNYQKFQFFPVMVQMYSYNQQKEKFDGMKICYLTNEDFAKSQFRVLNFHQQLDDSLLTFNSLHWQQPIVFNNENPNNITSTSLYWA